jgi:pimeloyl-ACP methyl ester carboxylesterase
MLPPPLRYPTTATSPPAAGGAGTDPARAAEGFITPRRQLAGLAERQLLNDARHLVVNHAGQALAAWQWGDTGRNVLLVHDWNSRASRMNALVPPLLAAGFRVCAFDMPGHGDSEGRLSSPLHMAGATLAVASACGPFVAVIGHGVGSLAARYAFAKGLGVLASVHVVPPLSLTRLFDGYAGAGGLDDDARAAGCTLVERFAGEPMAAMDLEVLRPGLAHPGLLIHDEGDPRVPDADVAALRAAWSDARLVRLAPRPDSFIGRSDVVRLAVAYLVSAAHDPLAWLRAIRAWPAPPPAAASPGEDLPGDMVRC